MNLIGFEFVSFHNEDEYINGLKFQLTKNQVLNLVIYFRSKNQWTEYYYHEINEYDLTNEEIIEVLNLSAPFWMEKDTLFSFTGWSYHNYLKKEDGPLVNEEKLILNSFYKNNDNISHSYLIYEDDIKKIKELEINLDNIISEKKLVFFSNNHRRFDTNNFYYKLTSTNTQELFFEGFCGIELDPCWA